MSLVAVSPREDMMGLEGGPEPEPAGIFLRAVEFHHCVADWRRPDGYWACTRHAGHRGRHRMRSASRPA
ncbi:MAG: hypothetical protein ACYCU7_17260 [Acidimicrobiales bacterium]